MSSQVGHGTFSAGQSNDVANSSSATSSECAQSDAGARQRASAPQARRRLGRRFAYAHLRATRHGDAPVVCV